MKIGFRLTLIMLVMSLASVGVLGTVLVTMAWRNSERIAGDLTTSMGRHMASEFQTLFETKWQKVTTAQTVMEQIDALTPESRRTFINDVLHEMLVKDSKIVSSWAVWDAGSLGNDDGAWIGTPGVDDSGRFVPVFFRTETGAIEMEVATNVETSDYNLEPRRRGMQIITNPYEYMMGQNRMTLASIAAPIHDRAGQIVGVVGIDIDLNYLDNIKQSLNDMGVGGGRQSSTMSAAFSNDGTVVSHFDQARVGRNLRETEGDIMGEQLGDMEDAVHSGKEMFFRVNVEGAGFWGVIIPVHISDFPDAWAIALAFPLSDALAETYRMVWFAVVMCLAILAAIVFFAVLISRNIVGPIKNMANTLKDIATGNGDLTVRLKEGRADEIGEASKFFNQTIEKIRDLVVSIKSQASKLSDIGNDLASNMTETAASMNQIAANIQSIKTRVINQSASVTETNATMEQVTVNIDRLSDHVQKQSHAVSQSSSAIEEMLANIQSVTATLVRNSANVLALRESSDSGRTSVQEVAGDIQEIARESEGLMEINSVMENIASQTNLLSMNAAIEAAHAGEAGKGFAVVADEIRKLAESSSEQSKTIGTVLKKIKGSIDKITRSTDDVLQKFEAIDHGVRTVAEQEEVIRAAMEEQGEGSRQVLEASGQVSEITQQVKGGSQEMLEGSREVIHESKNLERATHEIENGINEMASGADEVNRAVNSVNDLSGRNRENISVLVKAVSRFKV